MERQKFKLSELLFQPLVSSQGQIFPMFNSYYDYNIQHILTLDLEKMGKKSHLVNNSVRSKSASGIF